MNKVSADLDPGAEPLIPQSIRLAELRPEAWPDSKRIKVHITLTSYHRDLNLEVILVNRQQEKAGEVQLIGLPGQRFVFTMHLKQQNPGGLYRLSARLYSQENPCIDEKENIFELN